MIKLLLFLYIHPKRIHMIYHVVFIDQAKVNRLVRFDNDINIRSKKSLIGF